MSTAYMYDSQNRIISISHSNSNSNNDTLQSFTYTYDNNGNRTQVIEHTGRTVSYTYDTTDRLLSETITNDPHANNTHTTYNYDEVGNLLTKTVDATSTNYTYNQNDQLIQKTNETLTYDANGNLTQQGNNTYTYDAKNRLISVATPTDTIEYTYDANNNRTVKIVNGETTTYLIDTNTPYAQVITESKSNGTTIEYTYGNDLLNQTTDTQTLYYLPDVLGSIRELADQNQNITDSYTYTPYGELQEHTGNSENSFLYTGEQYDQETQNYYLRARYYSPENARFLTRDTYDGRIAEPITQNHYAYANSNPVMFRDPSGNMSLTESVFVSSTLGLMATFTYGVFQSNQKSNSKAMIPTTWLLVGLMNGKIFLQEEYADFIMHMASKKDPYTPYKDLERDFLDMGPGDPCSKIREYIAKMETQIQARQKALDSQTDSYRGHVQRIKILQKQIEKLSGYLLMGLCTGKK